MQITQELIDRVAGDMEVPMEELIKFVELGEKKTFPQGDYLFHE